MSADNWAVCPACHHNHDPEDTEHTLREDYEQGILPEGEYYVIYKAHCQVCGFHWEYNHSEQVLPAPSTMEGGAA